jgi:hypothetical protein
MDGDEETSTRAPPAAARGVEVLVNCGYGA